MRRRNSDIYLQLAKSPRKSYLGKARRLTPPQERWTRAIISIWADEMKGGDYLGYGGGGDGIWRFITGWSGENIERFTKVFDQLSKEGYTGQELEEKARAILFPKQSLSDMFQRANDVDEADFVEKAILKAFDKSNPIYVVATDYYLGRNTLQTLANYMQEQIAPWLTIKQCIDRVRWCISLFNAKLYMVMQDEIARERSQYGVEMKNISEIT
ncbi:TPA: hypothetical protein U2I32_003585 [Providencia rettgeri]|uniref:hypothetical protein n=1 Tax=Providencia sp. PROV167 TaxID=2949873 RepID=UPI00234A79CC|nr:hypothetical protein [Providencia sp. PROV167]ELQ1458318.1 hypothetical protein [Providencia rettgeri]HEM6924032.1 hypothetical protein [Providencia rettgeri]